MHTINIIPILNKLNLIVCNCPRRCFKNNIATIKGILVLSKQFIHTTFTFHMHYYTYINMNYLQLHELLVHTEIHNCNPKHEADPPARSLIRCGAQLHYISKFLYPDNVHAARRNKCIVKKYN